MKEKNSDNQNALKNYAKYSSIALQMLAIILLGVLGGVKIDEWVSWEFPVFTALLSIFSVVLAIYYVTRDFFKKDQSWNQNIYNTWKNY